MVSSLTNTSTLPRRISYQKSVEQPGLARASTLAFLFPAAHSAMSGPRTLVPSSASLPSDLASTAPMRRATSIASLCLLVHGPATSFTLPPPMESLLHLILSALLPSLSPRFWISSTPFIIALFTVRGSQPCARDLGPVVVLPVLLACSLSWCSTNSRLGLPFFLPLFVCRSDLCHVVPLPLVLLSSCL
jgi:hypothetical protein